MEDIKLPVCQRIGLRLARKVFEVRGNHSEAHLTEAELAVLLAAAAELGTVACTAPVGELKAADRELMMPAGGAQ